MRMKESLQELLLQIPMYQLTFLTPFPKEPIYYEEITSSIPKGWYEKPTLVIIQDEKECFKLNDKEIVNHFIQDGHLIGIIILLQGPMEINYDSLVLLTECQVPIVKIENATALSVFQQNIHSYHSYSQMSMELNGFIQKGFTKIAAELSLALGTPFIYFDENDQLLWQTGDTKEVEKALKWMKASQRKSASSKQLQPDLFEPYSIDVAGQLQLTLVVSAHLEEWQRKHVYKLIGLTALYFHTEELFREQQERLKEHFLYDVLYHKFESVKVMVKQGKALGWNLEKPHHLLVINVEEKELLNLNSDLKEEIVALLDSNKAHINKSAIIFCFKDQIVVLIEDEEKRTLKERKNFILEIAHLLEQEIVTNWQSCQVSIGIGKWYQNSINLNKSYQEAKLALQLGQTWDENKQLIHIDDLGIFHLLIHLHQDLLYDFSQDYLSLLIESDYEYGTEYIKTLKAYIQYQGIISDVSEALFIHPNTLRNRIKKIEEITGVDTQNPTEFMNLVVAMKIYYSMFR